MSQRLVLPFKAKKILLAAGYQVPGYLQGWGFQHFGHDYGFREAGYDTYACGDGEVVACGMDGSAPHGSGARLGNCIVIVYRDVLCNDGKVRDLACQMCHFAEINVRAGQRVTADTLIGLYGDTGGADYSPHLHIQFDADARNPRWMYGIAASGNVMRKGTVDSTVNPCKVWFLREGQSITPVNGESYYFPEEINVPALGAHPPGGEMVPRAQYDELVRRYEELWRRFEDVAEGVKALAAKV